MKIFTKFLYIIFLFNTTLLLSTQLDTLYTEDFTDLAIPKWEINSVPIPDGQTNANGLTFKGDGSNSIDILTSPLIPNLDLSDSLLLVTNDSFFVGNEDNLTLSISENGGIDYNIHFDLKNIVSDTINLSHILSSFNNVKIKYTIELNRKSSKANFWSIQSCRIFGRNILGGVAIVSTGSDDDDKERFYYECLPIGEVLNLNIILTNDFDDTIEITDLGISASGYNIIILDEYIYPDSINNNSTYQIGINNISLGSTDKAEFNIPLIIEKITSDTSHSKLLEFKFKIIGSRFDILGGSLPTQIGDCCQEEVYYVSNHTEPLPYFLKTNSYIEINDMRPFVANEKSILTAIDYILLEPKDTTQFISIFNQFSNLTDIFVAKMSIDTCVIPAKRLTQHLAENDPIIEKTSNKTKFENATVNIYPNPVSETLNFYITLEAEDEFTNLEIINTLGNIILKKKIGNSNSDFFEINTSLLSNGLYYAKIFNSNFVNTKKFYKK